MSSMMNHGEIDQLEERVSLYQILSEQVSQKFAIYKVESSTKLDANEQSVLMSQLHLEIPDHFVQVLTQQLKVGGVEMTAIAFNDMTEYIQNLKPEKNKSNREPARKDSFAKLAMVDLSVSSSKVFKICRQLRDNNMIAFEERH